MRLTPSTLLCILCATFCFPFACLAEQSLSYQQRLDLLPLPADASRQEKVDFTKDPLVEFSKHHSDFTLADPFSEANLTRPSLNDPIVGFTTHSSPRETFLFFKRFFNYERAKTDAERKLPYYNSTSYFDYDALNDGYVNLDKTIGNAAFYRINATGKEGNLTITIFNDGHSEETTVYAVAWDVPRVAATHEPIQKREYLVLSIESSGAEFEAAVTHAVPRLTGHVVLPMGRPDPTCPQAWYACNLTFAETAATLARLQVKELPAEGSPVSIVQTTPIVGTPAIDVNYQVPNGPVARAGISFFVNEAIFLAFASPDRPEGYRVFMVVTKS